MKVRNALGEETKLTWNYVENVIKANFADYSLIAEMAINGSETDKQLIDEYQYQLDTFE